MNLVGKADALAHFLDALDEWGCEDNTDRATEIIAFLIGGSDLKEYEESRELRGRGLQDRPDLRGIKGDRP